MTIKYPRSNILPKTNPKWRFEYDYLRAIIQVRCYLCNKIGNRIIYFTNMENQLNDVFVFGFVIDPYSKRYICAHHQIDINIDGKSPKDIHEEKFGWRPE